MLIVEKTTNQLKIIDLNYVFGKVKINFDKRIDLNPDSSIPDTIKDIIANKSIILLISNTKTYIHRFPVSVDMTTQAAKPNILNQALEIIPLSQDELIYDVERIDNNNVIFYAIATDSIKSDIESIEKNNGKVSSIYPSSRCLFELFYRSINPTDILMLVNQTDNQLELIFYDAYGPIISLNEPITDNNKISEIITKTIEFFENKYKKTVNKIINNTNIPFDSLLPITDLKTLINKSYPDANFSNTLFPIIGALLFNNHHTMNLNQINGQGQTDKPVNKFFVAFLALWALGLVIFVIAKNMPEKKTNTKDDAIESVSPTAVEPTQVTIDKKTLKIEVLNGSGTAGEAQKIADYLKNLGYDNFTTDNADNYDYKDVTVNVKSNQDTIKSTIIKDLESDYTIATGSTTLDSDSQFDVQIIIGK